MIVIESERLVLPPVNDPGSGLFNEYFNLSLTGAIRSWSTMETLVPVIGLAGVLFINVFA